MDFRVLANQLSDFLVNCTEAENRLASESAQKITACETEYKNRLAAIEDNEGASIIAARKDFEERRKKFDEEFVHKGYAFKQANIFRIQQAEKEKQAVIDRTYGSYINVTNACKYNRKVSRTDVHGADVKFTVDFNAALDLLIKMQEAALPSSLFHHNEYVAAKKALDATKLARKNWEGEFCVGLFQADSKQEEAQKELAKKLEEIDSQVKSGLKVLNEESTRVIAEKEKAYSDAKAAAAAKYSIAHAEVERQNKQAQVTFEHKILEDFKNLVNPKEFLEARQSAYNSLPSYQNYQPVESCSDGIMLGTTRIDLTDVVVRHKNLKTYITENLSDALSVADGKYYLAFPYYCAFTDPALSTMITYSKVLRSTAVSAMQAWGLQLIFNNIPGKVRFTMISPTDSGAAFSIFSNLNKGSSNLVGTRIWSASEDIERELSLLEQHADRIQQKDLKGRYKNIVEYNAHAGKNAEPLRFLFVSDFPNGFTPKAIASLRSLLSNGTDTGIFVFMSRCNEDWESGGSAYRSFVDTPLNSITDAVTHCDLLLNKSYARSAQIYSPILSTVPSHQEFIPLASPDSVDTVCQALNDIATAAEETKNAPITYGDVFGELLYDQNLWFHSKDTDGLTLPFAMTGDNEIVSLKLASNLEGDKTCHALICGNIRHGKSTILKALIAGIILKYSPEDVQIYALDFKEGIEFSSFAKYGLKNFRLISVKTESEFGLAAINSLHREMEVRAQKFKQMGVNTIDAYRDALARQGIIHHGMPRIVIIIDEYQVLMADNSDPIQQEAAAKLKDIIMRDGALGFNVILATQDIENAKALDATVYRQFGVRILLRNEASAVSNLIQGEQNLNQIEALPPGTAMFCVGANTANGLYPLCRAAYEDSASEVVSTLLTAVAQKQQQEAFVLPYQKTRVMLGSVEDDGDCPLALLCNGKDIPQYIVYRLFLGQELKMTNNFAPSLDIEQGENLLIASNNTDWGFTAVAFTMMSLLTDAIVCHEECFELGKPLFTVLDFTDDSEEYATLRPMFKAMQERLPETMRVFDSKGAVAGVHYISELAEQATRQFVIVVCPDKSNRFKIKIGDSRNDLMNETPAEILTRLMVTGPSNGMNFIVMTDNASSFRNNFSGMVDTFNYRLVGNNINKEDYSALLNDKGAEPRESASDSVFTYYDIDGQNKKVLLYAEPTPQWQDAFFENAKKLLAEQRRPE